MDKFFKNNQLIFVIYCVTVSYGTINLPRVIAENAGTGGWISLILTTAIFLFIAYIITYLQYNHSEQTLFEYSSDLLGKPITYIIIIIYIVYFFINFTMIARIYAEILKLIFLLKTPTIAVCFLLYLVVFYTLKKDLGTLVRLCTIYGSINIIGFILINFSLLSKGKLVNIMPLFNFNDVLTYINTSKKTIISFAGIEVLLFIPLSKDKNKKIYKYTLLTMIFIGTLYIFLTEVCISVVGIESLVYYKATVFNVIRGLDLYYLEFLRRLDGIYIIFWTMNTFCSICIWGTGTIVFTKKIIPRIKHTPLLVITILASFIVSQLPKTKDRVQDILEYNGKLGYITFLVIPLILLIAMKVKNNDKKA